jgi:oligopeptide transport system substrate-binding protein
MRVSEESFFSEHAISPEKIEEIKPLKLTYAQGERAHLLAQALQDQWREALGLVIELEAVERKVFFDRIARQDYELAFCSWGADFHDPINFLEVFKYRDQSTNNTHWEDLDFQKGLEESFLLQDPIARRQKLASCEKILLDALPIIPLFHYTVLYRQSKKLTGVFLSSMGSLDFKWARREDSK